MRYEASLILSSSVARLLKNAEAKSANNFETHMRVTKIDKIHKINFNIIILLRFSYYYNLKPPYHILHDILV